MKTVAKVTLPRGDLDVHLLGAALPTGMNLTSWAAFHFQGRGEPVELSRGLRAGIDAAGLLVQR